MQKLRRLGNPRVRTGQDGLCRHRNNFKQSLAMSEIKDERRCKRLGGTFFEFMGSAGTGQVLETSSLTFGNIDWKENKIYLTRRKTGELYDVPIYDWLRPLLERLLKSHATPPPPETKVFKIQGARKALKGACKRLGYHSFSERNIRAALIKPPRQSGVDKKLISKWQGHQDGGQTDY